MEHTAIPYLPTRLGYAHAVLLPIWERRTGGDRSLRRFLECPGDDPAGREERLHGLIRIAGALRRPGGHDAGAGAACLKVAMHAAERIWRDAVERVLAADREAGAPAEGQMAPG